MRRSGKRQAVEEPERGESSTAHRVTRPAVPSTESMLMRQETHPWLKWTGCTANEKIRFSNNLALLQDKAVHPPKFLDWDMLDRLGITAELNPYLTTQFVRRGGAAPFEVEVWRKAFSVRESIYRELCLEFYSTLTVDQVPDNDNEVYDAKIIHFRLGGEAHEVTLPQFGFLTGLFTEAEYLNRPNMANYIVEGSWNWNEIRNRKDEVWFDLSGHRPHASTNKANNLTDPIFRVLEKGISNSFLQRFQHQDKVYLDDLWLLYFFAQRNPTKYVNAPWALVEYMNEKGSGRQAKGPMVCGHFITRIAKRLGVLTQAGIQKCSPPVGWKTVTMNDLFRAKITTADRIFIGHVQEEEGDGDEEDEENEEEEGDANAAGAVQPPPGPFDFNPMMNELYRIGRRVDETYDDVRHIRSEVQQIRTEVDRTRLDIHQFGDYTQYHIERYQPMWDYMTTSHYHVQNPDVASGWTDYNPPPMWYQPPPNDEE